MLRFALHAQGQNSPVSTRCHGSLPVLQLKSHSSLGYRLQDLNVQRPTDSRSGLLPALNDRVSTRPVSR
jgi:hypothetical protein